ncbi:Putative ribonuclease H protein At1g65750 [Linum perenne]
MEDRWVWHYEAKGKFTVGSCYREMKKKGNQLGERQNNGRCKFWRWMWRLSLPPKLKFFLWRICHNALATRVNLNRRNCAPSTACPGCENPTETQVHIFFQCDSAKRFWSRCLPSIPLAAEEGNARDWLEMVGRATTPTTMIDITFALWTIWKSRNKLVFEGTVANVEDMYYKFMAERNEWTTHLAHEKDQRRTTAQVLQTPPTTQTPMIYQKRIMCDGAYKADIRYGAYGVIVYDSEGRVVDGRARSFFCRAPICAEALGILAAVHIATSDDSSAIILTDSMIMVTALGNEEGDWPWEVAGFLAQIKQQLDARPNVVIKWVNREVISKVDSIAKLARDNRLPFDWIQHL